MLGFGTVENKSVLPSVASPILVEVNEATNFWCWISRDCPRWHLHVRHGEITLSHCSTAKTLQIRPHPKGAAILRIGNASSCVNQMCTRNMWFFYNFYDYLNKVSWNSFILYGVGQVVYAWRLWCVFISSLPIDQGMDAGPCGLRCRQLEPLCVYHLCHAMEGEGVFGHFVCGLYTL